MGVYGKLGLFHRPKDEDKRAAMSALDEVGMRDFARAQIGELSGGQQQRVFVARSLVQNPALLLLDEPIAGVDATSQHAIFTLLEARQKAGMTIIARRTTFRASPPGSTRCSASTIASSPTVRRARCSPTRPSRRPSAATCSLIPEAQRPSARCSTDVDWLLAPAAARVHAARAHRVDAHRPGVRVVGVYVVLRNLAFIGDGLAHASFLGIVLAYMFKITCTWAASSSPS